jgi:PAS domain S-box-containing protein
METEGRVFSFLSTPIPDSGYVNLYGRDITERKSAEARLASDLAALTRMHALSERLLEAGDRQPVLQEIMDTAVAIMGAAHGTLQLLEGDSLRIVAHYGHEQPFLEFFASAENRASVCGEALQRGERVVVPDIEKSPLFVGTPSLVVLRGAGVRAVQSTPMVSRSGRLLGILTTQWGVPYSPDEHNLWQLDLLARQAADLIEHAQAEESLRGSEERLTLALNAGQIGMFTWNVPTGELFWTLQTELLLGYPTAATATTTTQHVYRDWADRVHPDDLPWVELRLRECMAQRKPYEAEYRVVWPDGSVHWIDARGEFSFDADGGATRLLGTAMDITDRKRAEEHLHESEQQFRTLADSIPNLAWWANGDGYITWYNRRWYEYTGTTPEQMEGWGWQSVHDPDELPRVLEHWRASIATGEPFNLEFPLRGRDGQFRWFLTRILPLKDANGRVVRWFGTNTDVTEVRQARQAAEAANLAKSRFLANMSHELRTPMNAILGMIDVALPKAIDPTVQDCLRTAKGSADLLLMLLNDLLDSAKIESGKLELESAPFSLRRMLDQITRVLAVRASENGLRFYCHMPEGTPDAVVGDRMRLQQVLLNLAVNAIKFTERGEVEVSVRVESQWAEQACLEFAVRDTGIGIPSSVLEHLFQSFAQADASMARRFGGTGLGLSICKSLVEMMGGRISVESEEGKGSTFYFTAPLPIAKELPSDIEAPVAVSAAACTQLRILLAEDNPANQKLATYVLEDRGHLVEIAGDGRQAVRLTERNSYDVILMDVQMPGMNGLETTAAIRKREDGGSRVPIIAMTAHAMKGDREQCLAAGMDGYVSKSQSSN